MKTKMTIDASQWRKTLAILSPAVASKTALPVLSDVVLRYDAAADLFTMTCSDGETWVTIDCKDKNGQPWIRLIEDDEKDKFSRVAIPFADLKESVGLLPSGQVLQVWFSSGDRLMRVNYGIGEFAMSWDEADMFPEAPAVAAQEADGALCRFTMPAEQLLPIMSAAVESAADDEIRPVMNAVCLDVFHDKLVVVATNGHELFKDVIETGVGWLDYAAFPAYDAEAGRDGSAALLVGKRARKVLSNAITDGALTVTADRQRCEFRVDGCCVVMRTIDGNYPNYESVIPKGEFIVTVSRDALRQALRRLQLSADKSSQMAELRRDGQAFVVQASDADTSRSGYERVQIQEPDVFLPDGFRIGFKTSTSISILDRIATDNVVLAFSGQDRAFLYRPEDVQSARMLLQMPMVLN